LEGSGIFEKFSSEVFGCSCTEGCTVSRKSICLSILQQDEAVREVVEVDVERDWERRAIGLAQGSRVPARKEGKCCSRLR
jgi:hypothetical protein